MKTSFIGLILFTIFSAANVFAQERCVNKQEADAVIARFNSPPAKNDNLRRELLKMREVREKLETKMLDTSGDRQNILRERAQLGRTQLLRVCEVIRQNGFPTKESLKPDGFEAAFYVITNNRAFDLQSELIPVLAAATSKEILPRNYFAQIVDNIRIGRGLPQIFGTQAKIVKDVIYLYPLLNENRVAEWRKSYNLPPLANFIRELEYRHSMPVLKSSRPANLEKVKQASEKSKTKDEAAALGFESEDEILTVNTKLVNLNVQILNQDLTSADSLNLTQNDFAVYENGKEQPISFFSNTDQPFDLVLLLDFSGSTIDKQDLIKKAAQRFVELARPADRVAVIAFTHEIRIVSDLTTDRQTLNKEIKKLEMKGGSRIWDALKFTYKNIIEKQSHGRRSAVVFMTDGVDGSLNTTYADLMEIVRQGETTIFPVYLDPGDYEAPKARQMAEKSMAMLAEESGGQIYPTRKIKDLVGIYERVVKDLSRVYSISYEPTDDTRDGAWRELQVKIKSQPNLVVRSRQGYYAN